MPAPYEHDIYTFSLRRPEKFTKYGYSEVTKKLPPPGNFFHVVAVVPEVHLANKPAGFEGSAVENHLPGWDAAVQASVGVLHPYVYVNASTTKPHILTFDLDGKVTKHTKEGPVEVVKDIINERMPNVVYNLQGDQRSVENFIHTAGEDNIPGERKLYPHPRRPHKTHTFELRPIW